MRHEYKKNPAAWVLAGLYSNTRHWLRGLDSALRASPAKLSRSKLLRERGLRRTSDLRMRSACWTLVQAKLRDIKAAGLSPDCFYMASRTSLEPFNWC